MQALLNWIVSHPELVGWAVLSAVGALWPDSRVGSLARRWASDLRGPGKSDLGAPLDPGASAPAPAPAPVDASEPGSK